MAGVPAADGRRLRVRWTKWAVVGTPSGKVQDVGLTSEVVWTIENGTLFREETLSSKQPVSIRRWWLAVPTTCDQVETGVVNGVRVSLTSANFPLKTSIMATGNSALGRGVRGAIPLHLVFEAKDIKAPLKFKLALTPK